MLILIKSIMIKAMTAHYLYQMYINQNNHADVGRPSGEPIK